MKKKKTFNYYAHPKCWNQASEMVLIPNVKGFKRIYLAIKFFINNWGFMKKG